MTPEVISHPPRPSCAGASRGDLFVWPTRPCPLGGRVVAAGFAEPLQHKPSRLLGDADLRVQLQAADTFAARDKQIHRVNPLVQWHLGPLENRAGADGEVGQAGVAAVEAAFAGADALGLATCGADSPVRPARRLEIEAGAFRIGEPLEQFEGADCGARHLGGDRQFARSAEGVLAGHIFAVAGEGLDNLFISDLETATIFAGQIGAKRVAQDDDMEEMLLLHIVIGTFDNLVAELEHSVSPCFEAKLPPDKKITTLSRFGSQVYNSQIMRSLRP